MLQWVSRHFIVVENFNKI